MQARDYAQRAQTAARGLASASPETRRAAIRAIASELKKNVARILEENDKDLKEGRQSPSPLADAVLDRLALTKTRIESLADATESIASQPEVLGFEEGEITRPSGITVRHQRIPIGVIAVIFESRPNVVVDCSALCIKSGNAAILKGGKEALHTNTILAALISEATKDLLPPHSIQVLPSDNRELTQDIMRQDAFIDLLIPRGGHQLIAFAKKHATIPVMAHDQGLCHLYVDASADLNISIPVASNSKTSRPGVCNALETLLVDASLTPGFLQALVPLLLEQGVELRGCDATRAQIAQSLPAQAGRIQAATETDWQTEYLAPILSIKLVEGVKGATDHIARYGSRHTEGICAANPEVIQQFLDEVDASCITINSSTRFNDGGELGLGAEIGISTTKIHSYGPMGAQDLTTTRYVVSSQGATR